MLEVSRSKDGIVIPILVKPSSGLSCVSGIKRGSLEVKVLAPAQKGKANKECLKVLAKFLEVPTSSLKILKGEKARTKKIFIPHFSVDRFLEILKKNSLL